MSRFPVINPDLLPTMAVLETIDSEDIIDARMARFKTLWNEYDPPNAAQYDVEELEFDPIIIQTELASLFETYLRDRVNQAARAVTLVFAVGTDLEAIGSRYPGGMPKLSGESDAAYRRRIWLSPNGLSPHGVEEVYVLWALTAAPTLRDASAVSVPGSGRVTLTIANDGDAVTYEDGVITPFPDPTPTTAQLGAVAAYVKASARKGITQEIIVAKAKSIHTNYRIKFWLYPSYDQESIERSLRTGLADLIESQRWLGFDHTHKAIIGVFDRIAGIYDCEVVEPADDVIAAPTDMVVVDNVTILYSGINE